MNKDNWYYIGLISDMSPYYGNILIDMMMKYKKSCLEDITKEEAKEYYNYLLNN